MPIGKHDWTRADALTDDEVHAAAQRDSDAQPMTDAGFARMCRALGLTQEESAARFQIPLGALRDWEQGRAEPDETARAYLRAIAGDAAAVQHALEMAPRSA